MIFSTLAPLVFAPMMVVGPTPVQDRVSCQIGLDVQENSIIVTPSVLGLSQQAGRYEVSTTTLTGSNRSYSIQNGTFVIGKSDVLQTVAVIQVALSSASQLNVKTKIILEGQSSECEISYP